jgi:uncharacterized protein
MLKCRMGLPLNGFTVCAALLCTFLLTACADEKTVLHNQSSAQIEALGLVAGPGRQDHALEKLLSISKNGNVIGQREAGLTLILHRSPPQQEEGIAWLSTAAAAGDAEAAFTLGEASQAGTLGQLRDSRTAAKYFEMAANRGHAKAALMIARMLKNGDGVERAPQQAAIWLRKAAEGGNPQAMLLLSNAFASGDSFPQSDEQAVRWLEAAADKHYPPAIQALAHATEGGQLGLKRDSQLASDLWKEAAEESRNHWKTQ